MENKIEVNGKVVDLSLALPLTMGDWEDLEDVGVTMDKLSGKREDGSAGGSISFKTLCSFLLHVLFKSNKDITRNDVRTISLDGMKDLMEKINPKSDEVRNPQE